MPEKEFPATLIEKNDPTVELETAMEEARRAAIADLTSEEEDYEEQLTDDDDELE